MKFGEWVGAAIAGNAGAKVMKIGYSHFNTDAVVSAAKCIDAVALGAQIGGQLTPFETLMIEILFDLAGWSSPKEANESYQRYLKSEDTHDPC